MNRLKLINALVDNDLVDAANLAITDLTSFNDWLGGVFRDSYHNMTDDELRQQAIASDIEWEE